MCVFDDNKAISLRYDWNNFLLKFYQISRYKQTTTSSTYINFLIVFAKQNIRKLLHGYKLGIWTGTNAILLTRQLQTSKIKQIRLVCGSFSFIYFSSFLKCYIKPVLCNQFSFFLSTRHIFNSFLQVPEIKLTRIEPVSNRTCRG